MMQCFDGLKHLSTTLLTCCDADLPPHCKTPLDPKGVARGTVCMSLLFLTFTAFFEFDSHKLKSITTPNCSYCE